MKTILISCILSLFIQNSIIAQSTNTIRFKATSTDKIIHRFVSSKLKFGDERIDDGTIVFDIKIDKDGDVKNIEINSKSTTMKNEIQKKMIQNKIENIKFDEDKSGTSGSMKFEFKNTPICEELDNKSSGNEVFMFVEKMPEFPGGEVALQKFLQMNIHYPTFALENDITGKVYMEFTINGDGKICNIKILKDIGGGCGAEAEWVIMKMPDWIPGEQSGKKVSVKFNLPIVFDTN
jgi:hypothetical protein